MTAVAFTVLNAGAARRPPPGRERRARGPRMIDLLVVGGGPAGMATALHAAAAGLSVKVLEPRRVPIDKACGEGLMPRRGGVAAAPRRRARRPSVHRHPLPRRRARGGCAVPGRAGTGRAPDRAVGGDARPGGRAGHRGGRSHGRGRQAGRRPRSPLAASPPGTSPPPTGCTRRSVASSGSRRRATAARDSACARTSASRRGATRSRSTGHRPARPTSRRSRPTSSASRCCRRAAGRTKII